MSNKWTNESLEQIKALIDQGKTYTEIATAMNTSYPNIVAVIGKHFGNLGKKKKWAKAEIDMLTELKQQDLPIEAIAAKLKRSQNAVSNKIMKLDLSDTRAYWTDANIKLLTQHYPTMDNKDLAKLIGCEVVGVRNMAAKLKLKKAERFWPVEDEIFLMKNWDVMGISDFAHKFNRSKWSIYGKYHALKKKGITFGA